MKKYFINLCAAALAAVVSTCTFADSFDVYGEFWVEDRGSKIKIQDCGDSTPCGRVVWIDPQTLEPGQTPETVKSKAGEPVLGLQILNGFTRKRNDWRGGKIYSPKVDKTYSSRMKRLENGNLQVKGCIAFLCETQIWAPVKGSIDAE